MLQRMTVTSLKSLERLFLTQFIPTKKILDLQFYTKTINIFNDNDPKSSKYINRSNIIQKKTAKTNIFNPH